MRKPAARSKSLPGVRIVTEIDRVAAVAWPICELDLQRLFDRENVHYLSGRLPNDPFDRHLQHAIVSPGCKGLLKQEHS